MTAVNVLSEHKISLKVWYSVQLSNHNYAINPSVYHNDRPSVARGLPAVERDHHNERRRLQKYTIKRPGVRVQLPPLHWFINGGSNPFLFNVGRCIVQKQFRRLPSAGVWAKLLVFTKVIRPKSCLLLPTTRTRNTPSNTCYMRAEDHSRMTDFAHPVDM